MIERVKRWLASSRVNHANRAGKLERPNGRRPCNLHIFVISSRLVCRSRSVSEQRRSRCHSAKVVRKSNGNRRKIDGKSIKIGEKSKKIPSQAVWDARNRFGNALGRARDVTGTPKTRLRADLGAPRASQERPGAVRKRPWASPERLPDRLAAVSERVWSIERCQT